MGSHPGFIDCFRGRVKLFLHRGQHLTKFAKLGLYCAENGPDFMGAPLNRNQNYQPGLKSNMQIPRIYLQKILRMVDSSLENETR